jgi:hypothetical protein
MPFNNKMAAALFALVALLGAGTGQAGILFQETFDDGANPFAFDAFQDGRSPAAGQLAIVGPPYERAWLTVLPPGKQQGLFGHRLVVPEEWRLDQRLHWAAHLKFGDRSDRPQWQAAGDAPYQLDLPAVIGVDGRALLIGRFRKVDRLGRFGTFELVTADGRVHRPIRGDLLAANRWYAIEFSVEDRGAHDRVRIWIDNADEQNPDYELVGGDMVDADDWRPGVRFDHGYVIHDVPAQTQLYYDNITIADGFIGLPVTETVRPAAPGGMQVR